MLSRQFARIFTAENVLQMKNTVQAVESNAHAAKVRYEASQGGKGKLDKETGENVRLRRTGPGLEKMRKAHKTLRNLILTRFGSMTAAFKDIDKDGSGTLRRAELRSWLQRVSKSIPDQVRTARLLTPSHAFARLRTPPRAFSHTPSHLSRPPLPSIRSSPASSRTSTTTATPRRSRSRSSSR